MPTAAARERSSSAGLLSIGQVLARLSPEFPTLTSSKLRFLEVQGIVTPLRTESGYRKFSPADLERLRLALTLQRDHYLPLVVIREYLEDIDAGRDPVTPTAVPPPSIVPAPRRYRRDELLSAAGVRAEWSGPPTAEEIRVKDQVRMLADPLLTEAPSEEELEQARLLLADRSPEAAATAFLRLYRQQLPAPEDLYDQLVANVAEIRKNGCKAGC